MARVAVVSYRLSGADGVSVEAAKWIAALRALGHQVTTVAGSGRADVLVPGLALDATETPDAPVAAALDGVDLVVIENVGSLPLNPSARESLYRVLAGRATLWRHHDLPWQRPHLARHDAPHDDPKWRHVTINEISRAELAQRGIVADCVPNTFDCNPPRGDRTTTRAALGLGDEWLALLAGRALERKNVPGALALCEEIGATLWVLGPAEDGYGSTLDALIARSSARVILGLPTGHDVHDAYTASDLVVQSSTWEGFGNPTIEAFTHRRPLALYPYPVSREITRHGFRFFGLDDAKGVADFLTRPDEELYDHNLALAREHYDIVGLPARFDALLAPFGLATAGASLAR
ncbi:MAG TPA: glycosyltransferase family 4 protein [Acidimicrobiales bacterium]|nr:glycosyltransferase family 4 protein [Acidimicrobiales bacterium]